MKNLLLSLLFTLSLAHAADRPNVIVVMADDIGFECVSSNGSKMYSTPNIDALAASGMRFENAHSQPICTPSRVQMMTGIYNNKNYIEFGLLDPEQVTFGNLMKRAGYKTCIAGKWQLQGGYEGVKNFGFDRHCLWQLTRRPSRYANPGLEIDGEEKDFKDGGFGPHIVNDYVCDYLEENKASEKPFFVYYPMIEPHWPFIPTPGSPDWDPAMWKDKKNEPGGYKNQQYWDGMVKLTDDMIGRLVKKLEETGLRDNTLLIFTGDNGTYTGVMSTFKDQPYPGGKGSPKDNGTHVPFVASWPEVIKPGQTRGELVDFSDILPTIVSAAGAEIPANVDGHSLLPLFKGDPSYNPRDYVYCWYERNGDRNKATQHVRTARFKLYSDGRFYDTQADLLEKNKLAPDQLDGEAKLAHSMLKNAIKEHIGDTTAADPIQTAKQKKTKKAKKAE
jgi:arylsulfatase A